MWRTAREKCRNLPPAAFAPVMATGIVSRALDGTGAHLVGALLLGVAGATYLALLAASTVKVVCHPDRVRAELRDPARAFGHFTFVAASGVLAARLGGPAPVTVCLPAAAAVVWVALGGAVLELLRSAPRVALARADGSWFLATVGLQSLVIAVTGPRTGRTAVAVALGLWALGVLLYAATLAVIVRRLLRHPPGPAGLGPSYWVTMGAAAISTLAGAQLLAHGTLLPGRLPGPLTDMVLILWGWATVLIPFLVAAGIWRHVHHRVPLVYDPALWCIVFPLGMYTTATAHLAAVPGSHPPATATHLLAWTALAAWLAVHGRLAASRLRARRP
ncbi:tellurite resistance/C4-dicarboxylate transporter family protein [Streptomyces sp. NPDC095613]|uniref:tellurite resistance/C4-dicarboxylate transporter family protein n=1 Tax=Streptomyces sp. NPDC095613 TaxID=3155540 RepID=UPI00332A85CB